MQQFLPLAHHAHIFVVEDEDLHRKAILHRRGHFLHVHEDRGLARDVDDQRLGMGHLHADGGGQAIAHGAKAAGGHPAVGLLEVIVLGRPHLMLADFGGDVGVAILGQLIEALHRILRLDGGRRRPIGQRLARAPMVDLLPPGAQSRVIGLVAFGAPDRDHVFEHMGAIAHDGQVDLHVLVDGRWINIDVDLLRTRREGVEATGDAVVEPRADRDHEIAIMHGVIGLVGAMHAQHAQPVVAGGRIGAKPHEGRGDGEARHGDQFAQQRGRARARIDDAAARVKHRTLRPRHHGHGLADAVNVALQLGLIGLVLDVQGALIEAQRELHILR